MDTVFFNLSGRRAGQSFRAMAGKSLIALILAVGFTPRATAQEAFERYFEPKTLRIDFALSGNSEGQAAALQQLREEPVWAGPTTHLTDPFEYGEYCVKLYDAATKQLIFSRGFNTLFSEWLTTEQARTETQSWSNSTVVPYPKQPVVMELQVRNRADNSYRTLMHVDVDPQSIFIDRSPLTERKINRIRYNGDSTAKVDLVFIPEGYTAAEMNKFAADVQRFTDALLATPPFDTRRNDFNVWSVEVPSEQSGTDVSGKGVYRNTAFNSGFYTFGTERYLTTRDIKAIRDAVWNVPCDAVFMLVNSDLYGGSGMYNFYASGTADNARTIEVFVHELGHSFAALADEYFTSETSYNDFYSLTAEPWEPNITTLVKFDHKKWKDMLPAGTPIPTPVKAPYADKVGVFEGGGYLAKGIYRPADRCMMRDLTPFCPVCSRAIVRMIDYWTGKKL